MTITCTRCGAEVLPQNYTVHSAWHEVLRSVLAEIATLFRDPDHGSITAIGIAAEEL